jgi:uncharacterized protein YjbI with pentapeptide repeats/DNA polymerase III epsilon subunit-like protein
MQDVLRSALGDEKMKIIAALETWYVEDRNEVFQINTRGGHRRRGIAAEMFNTHREVFPERDLQHSDALSEDGKAFSAATPSSGRLSSGAVRRAGRSRAIYDESVDYNDKRNPSELLETSRDGKEYSSIRFNGDGYDIKTSQSEDGFSVFIENESGQIASLTFSKPPTGETASLLSYKASKESQKAGVLEALLDHVLVKNPDTNITSSAETRRWFNYVNNGTADYGAKGFRKYGFFAKYSDGEDVLRDGDYTFESDLLLKTSNVSSSPVVEEGFTPKEYIWTGQVFKIGNESIVFGAHEQAEFGDGIKKLPLNPFEILKLDPSSAEGRKAAQKWYSAVHGADVSVLAESSDFNASSYVSALLYAASKGNKDAQKEFDEFAKYSDSLLEKLDSKLPAVDNPEKALSLDARMIHQTSYKPTIDEKGYLVLRPLEDFPQTAKDGTEVTVNRTTLHFAVNHLAEGHLFRKETEGESYVVIAPLDSFIKENPDSLENFNIVDTAASPPPGDGLRFPPGSYKLVEIKKGEDGRKKVEDILRADGIEVLAGGERNSGTPGADEAGGIRAQMLGVSPNVASDLTLANLEQVNRTHISAERRYADVPSSTSFFQEASKNALLRIANRKENTWVSASRKLNDKDPLGDSKFRLASGKAPRYPREPTLGAFLEGAEERFDGVNSWEEFKERYAETEMVFLDYETTGLDFDEFGKATTNGNPTQIGLVRMKNGKEIGRLNLFMNPEQPLGEWSLANLKDADGNPITNEWLATQMPMAEAHRQVAEFIGPDAIIGVQNATFDKRVLEDALEREGIDWRPSGYLDTRDISAMTLPVWSEESPEGPYVTDRDGNKKPSSSLAAITEYLDVELGDGHHNADADAFATSQVMQKIIDRAIENGWSTDVLDREKRDSKLKADNDKFNADVEKFESDKEAFVTAQKEEGSTRLSSGANVVEAFNEPTEVTQQEAADIGLTRESLTGKKVAERIIKKIEETTGKELTKQQKYSIEDAIPGLTREIAGKTLLDVEVDDAFSETGKQLLESISIDISSDGIPFVSADPIPQLAEQIPDKRDWRTVELPKRDDIVSILDEAMNDVVVFNGSVWKDSDGNIIARKIYKNDASTLEFENDEARERFPLLEMLAPKGFVIRGDSISLPALTQDTLPEPYLEAWKKHSKFVRELTRRAGELMGDEEFFLPGSRISHSTDTYLRGYIGGITDPHKFNMGLYGKALQDTHDLFGHLGTGRAFDRHGEWANDLAMMSLADHPDSPLTPQEKMAVKHLHYMMYSAERMLRVGRLDEYDLNMNETMGYRNRPRTVFNIEGVSDSETRIYAGDFNSVLKKLDAASTTRRLSSGRKPIYEANEEDIELALAHDILGKSDRLSSGRQREMIPMNVPSKKREGAGATGYRTKDSSGNMVSRYSSTWLAGLSSEEISKVVVPVNADEHFEMWADDIAGPNWRTSKKQQKFIKDYYAELQKDSTNIPIDYSPESVAATQKLVKDLLDSSPSVMWVMQNFGAPLIVPFTREGMDAYENSPDMKERLALLAKQRGTEKIPFVSGLANRSLGSIGISPRALIDRESLLNDDKGVYPISLDPDRVPAPRDAHIDRSLEGTIVHEFGHWLHHRALWDTETNGASGKMRSYYGTGKLSDPRYVASLDVAEEYADYDTDDKRIEIYSQFIDLTGRSPEEMFRAHPDEPLLSTSYGNINKREAMAEAFVAIMHPNKEMPEKTLSKKLRKDVYTLIGVDEKDLPWSDSEAGSENRLSSGAKKGKRKTIFSRFGKEETEEETVEEKRKPPVVERPEGLVSFAPEPSEELLKVSPVPDEQTLKDEVLRDVQSLALEFDEGALGSPIIGLITKANVVAKKTIASNLSRSLDFDVEDFIEAFTTDKAGFGFHSTETFAAVQKMYETLKNLPADATSTEKRTAARGAFDSKNGRIISAKIHDDILGRARYYDEILDKLETEEFDELFGSSSFAELMATNGGEKSLFTPYLMTKLGTDDIKREFLEEIVPRREVLNNLIAEIKENKDKAFALARTGEPNPKTGEQDYELISLLGRGVDKNIIDAMSSLDISDEDYGQKFADILSAFNSLLTGQKLIRIRESGLVKIDSSNIDSLEIQKALRQHLVANVRSRSGNYESKTENYTKKTGVVFFDLETTEGKLLIREALVSDLIHTWAISANNANPVALAIQHEARKMFGLDEAMGWSTSPLKALRPEEKQGMPAHQFDGAPELTDTQMTMIRPILQKIYDSTQLYYKTKGITHIPVYRGFTQSDTRLIPGEIESMNTTMRPLSSWATSMDVARSFSGQSTASILKHTPTLIKSFVPVEDVFSNALTGFGCLNEDEVVLLGKPMKVLAMSTDPLRPLSMDSPIQEELLEKLKTINMENINEEFESIERRKNVIVTNAEKIEELFNSGSDMRNMELSNTDLVGKKLSGADLSGTKMNYANMREIDLSNADLSGAELSRADLSYADLSNANLLDAQLIQTQAKGVRMIGANLSGADLTDANFENAKLDDARLTGARLKGTNLRDAYFFDADLQGANLQGADLYRAMLHGANLAGANLQGASLTDATLTEADLTSANLEGVSLLGANLEGANLEGANLRGANLNGVKLDGANLRGADLTDTVYADYRPSAFLSSGKKSHTPEWKTVEEIVDFEVLGASPDDSEEDRDDIVKESVGGDWMQWDPCREIRTAAYELAGIDEYSERDPNISQSGGFFGNSKFQTTVSPEKRTEQARYLMASVIDSLINGRKYDRQPYLYRAMMFSSPEEGKQFFDAMQVGSQVDIPLLAFVEIGPSPRGDHFLTRFGSDALLVLEDFPGSYQTGGTFEPVFSNRHESDTLYNINEFAEAILADIENGEVDEENADYDKEFADKLIKLVEDYREAKTPLEKSNIKIDIEEALDEVGNETIKREWEGEPLPEDHEEYYDAMDDEDAGMTPREFVSGGRLEVVSVKPDESKAYRQIITLRQVGAFDPQEKGALVIKTDGENSTRLSSGKKPVKKAKPKSVQLHDDEFEKKFNQEVPDGDGDCFSEAVQQARKLAEAYDKVKIVHGYPLGTGGEAKGLRFPHAWAEFERDGEVWVRDYSNGNRIEFPQILYYGIGNIEENDVSRYDIKEAEANMIESEHYGPW